MEAFPIRRNAPPPPTMNSVLSSRRRRLLIIIATAAAAAASAVMAAALPAVFAQQQPPPSVDCLQQKCGSISNISYPFTLTSNNASCPSFSYSSTYNSSSATPSNVIAADHAYFQLYCNLTTNTLHMLPDPVYNNSPLTPLPITAILNDSLIIDFSGYAAVMKPPADGNTSNCTTSDGPRNVILPPGGPYVVSDDNDFASFGCSLGYLYTGNVTAHEDDPSTLYYHDHGAVGGCSVLLPDDVHNPLCGDGTCCIDSLPPASDLPTRYAYIFVRYTNLVLNVTDPACTCSNNYATIFHSNYTDFSTRSFGVKIKWALPSPNFNDSLLLSASADYACNSSAVPVPVPDVGGYLCSCKPGFTGDGYAGGAGCSDVDECSNHSLNTCVEGSKCVNTKGNYTCKCGKYKDGDGRKDGTGCELSPSLRKIIFSVSGILGFLCILGIIVISIVLWTKRVKRRYFMLNGGFELQEFMKRTGHNTTRIFTAEELKVATNNYADDMKIGSGGFGAVYKGKLQNGVLVAIKKSIKLENSDNADFLNEIAILTKINHKHIVQLLGCCLETKAPLLVYEFVSNGTLAENLERNDGSVMLWEQRLKVALETSEALAYLHRAASPPILHRDVKSANVLLDENWGVKVADFGVSRLVPDGIDHVSTAVQGTLGYLDPEYFRTLQLTDKSDVYSFGVVLVELITTLKPVDSHHREPQFSNLALLFIHHIKEGRLQEIVDPRLEMVDVENSSYVDWAWKIRSSILSVAALAHRCLALLGHDRPSMVEVERELRRISQFLYATNMDNVEEESPLLYEVGAVTIENDQYIIQSGNSYSSTSTNQGKLFRVSTLGR